MLWRLSLIGLCACLLGAYVVPAESHGVSFLQFCFHCKLSGKEERFAEEVSKSMLAVNID